MIGRKIARPLTEVLRPTTIVRSSRLSEKLGLDVTIASEAFQHTGSFKFRAAYNVALNVDADEILTASSGNFGQAMAYSCRLLDKACTVVMPATSARVKIEAVQGYGGRVDLVDVTEKSRLERVSELARVNPAAYVASPFDDPLVIEGNATLGRELTAQAEKFDVIVAPIGGGGLSAGIIRGLSEQGERVDVIGAEPLLGNDAARSLREGRLIANEAEPLTIADGARTLSLGRRNWEVIKDGIAGIVEVPEERIKEGVRMLFTLANMKAEPTGALALAAVLTKPQLFRGQRLCCVVSGGNVDPELYSRLINPS